MSNLRAEKIRRWRKNYKEARQLLYSVFPPDELISFHLLMLFTVIKRASFLAFYDDDKFAGFTYLVHFKGECYVFYLAVDETARGCGYGSKILTWIKENYRGEDIILDVEAPQDDAVNAPERLKRIEFYHKSGIVDTGYTLMDNGIKYMVLSSSPSTFNPDNMVKCWRRYAFGLFSERPEK